MRGNFYQTQVLKSNNGSVPSDKNIATGQMVHDD